MTRTHVVFQTPAKDFIINSMAETELSEEDFHEMRVGHTVEYPDGFYTCMYTGTYDQCNVQIQRYRTLTPLKKSPQNLTYSTPKIHKTPPFTNATTSQYSSFSSSRNKRKIHAITEEDEDETEVNRPSNFKVSRRMEVDEDEYQTLKDTVHDLTQTIGNLSERFTRLQNELDETKAENASLRTIVDKIRSPSQSRANQPSEDELSKLKIIDENDEEILLSSISERRLKLLLERKQQSLGPPPSHPGLNHQDVIDKIGDEMLYELSKKSTMGFALRLASYFIEREAFLKTYFKPLVPHNGNNHPVSDSKRTINDTAYKLIKYYAKFFAACLFDYSPHNCNRWMVSLTHSLNRKVDYLNAKIRENKTAIYHTYDDHNPLFTTANCFVPEPENEE